jgi:hypothetical protein
MFRKLRIGDLFGALAAAGLIADIAGRINRGCA